MAKNKKPAKKYRPKPVHLAKLPVVFRFDNENEIALQLLPHEALTRFKDGSAEEENWHTLASRINLGSTLAYTVFESAEGRAVMDAAALALKDVYDRFRRLEKMGMTGEEYNKIGAGLNLSDEMQAVCTRRELREAMHSVLRNAAINRSALPIDVLAAGFGVGVKGSADQINH